MERFSKRKGKSYRTEGGRHSKNRGRNYLKCLGSQVPSPQENSQHGNVGKELRRSSSNLKPYTHPGCVVQRYQMIKFIDFCEVWFLPESVARVAAIVGEPAATRLGIDSKRLWMCSWGTADQAASTRCQS
ncbi:hypothetical protein TNCV_1990161 [Trichonephila clavipes]|nr:hypothetical protein TNCV_1990161 [Trichonephila clavipes]